MHGVERADKFRRHGGCRVPAVQVDVGGQGVRGGNWVVVMSKPSYVVVGFARDSSRSQIALPVARSAILRGWVGSLDQFFDASG